MLNTSFWAGRKVLVTGHTGFKGSWLSLWLSELGADVCGVALEPESTPALFNQLGLAKQLSGHHRVDIRDPAALASIVSEFHPQVVLHLAAQPLVRRSYQDPLGTWETNVQGTLNLLEALKSLKKPCAVVMVTTDKVYANQEWNYGYREDDRLGGHDPYSASKAAAELAISSWRSSFCGKASHQTPYLSIATARAGNVIGGGDWAEDRIVPDAMRSLATRKAIAVRRPNATRPWQHVIEPLYGYMRLAESLLPDTDPPCESFNFGPTLDSNRTVSELVKAILEHWPGQWVDQGDSLSLHEANLLHLQIDKIYHRLKWSPIWDFSTTVERTVKWYQGVHNGESPMDCCINDLNAYTETLLTSQL